MRFRVLARVPVTLGLALLAAALAVIPLVAILVQAADVGVGRARTLLWRPLVGELVINTVTLTVAVTALCMLVGLAAAWCVERSSLPFRRVLGVLLVLPIAIPEYVNGASWVALFPGLHGFWAAVLVMTLSHFPLVYLPSLAMLRAGNPALVEAARGLGHGPWSVFRRVTLPQVRTALVGGGLIIALHLLAEYGGFAVLRYRTFATEIFNAYKLGFDAASAALLSLVLVALSFMLVVGERRMRVMGAWVDLGPGAKRAHRRVRLGRWTPLVVIGLVGLLVLALGVPIGSLIGRMIEGQSTTLPSSSIVSAALNTALFGAGAALFAAVLALPVAWNLTRRPGRLADLIERVIYLPRALPGLVVGLALVYIPLHYVSALYQSRLLLVIGYTVLFLPLAFVSMYPAVSQLSPRLEEAARSLGRGPASVFRSVTLPLISRGLGAAVALVFLSSVTELTGTLLLRPTGVDTLSTEFWRYTGELAYGAAAPYALVMIGLSALPALVLIRRLDMLGNRGV